MRFTSTVAAAALAAGVTANGNYLGFNSGSMYGDKSAKFQKDWEKEFKTAANLKGAPGDFTSIRLYTNIQAYSEDDPIEAFQAAINTDTNLLLGIWCSGTDNIDKELSALQKAVDKYGKDFTDLVIGISIGSEDLYRNSVTGVTNDAGIGNDPDNVVGFIKDYKEAFKGTAMEKVPVGHVDTWDAWTNSSNSAVLDAVDWLGVDEYPYYESGKGNDIDSSGDLFSRAYDAVVNIAGDKDVWVTETGWPYTGKDWDKAHPSVENAKKYWDTVGCGKLFGKVNTFWYNLLDENSENEQKFAITEDMSTTPRFNLTCPAKSETTASATTLTAPTSSATSGSSKSGSGSGSGSGSDSSSGSGSGSGSSTDSGSKSGTQTGASPAATTSDNGNGAASFQVQSMTTYAGLTLLVGAFALL